MSKTNGSAGPARQSGIGIRMLVADEDPSVLMLLGKLLRETEGISFVLEVENGAKAVAAARDLPFDVAVLDLNMPRLDGVQAARLLLAVDPSMRVALHSSDPDAPDARAEGLGLPLFDKLDFNALVSWVTRREVSPGAPAATVSAAAPRRELSCSECGYGIVTRVPPPQCPMCHALTTWVTPNPVRDAAVRQLAMGL
jgi:CheY-like chemotaxis protein